MLLQAALWQILLYIKFIEGSIRRGVLITGTTLKPFHRAEGTLAVTCPSEYPYSIANFTQCCRAELKRNAPGIHPDCDGGLVEYTTPEECCLDNEVTQCSKSKGAKCRSSPIDATWGTWSSWESCHKISAPNCQRHRDCDPSKARFGGDRQCSGSNVETKDCGCTLPVFVSCNATSILSSYTDCDKLYDGSPLPYLTNDPAICPNCDPVVLYLTIDQTMDVEQIAIQTMIPHYLGGVSTFEFQCADPASSIATSVTVPVPVNPMFSTVVTLNPPLENCRTIRVELVDFFDPLLTHAGICEMAVEVP